MVLAPPSPQLGRAIEAAEPEPEAEPIEEPATAPPGVPLPEHAVLESPPLYRVRVTTTEGEFLIVVDRNLAPHGAKRFFNLVQLGYFRNVTFFRAIPNFMVQFGIHGDPQVNAAWRSAKIPADPVNTSNVRGTVVFAHAGPGTSTTQLFINLGDNHALDGMSFAPIGHVVEGMDVVDRVFTGYGEAAPSGRGPQQKTIQEQGDAYLAEFPDLTRIIDMSVI